MPTYDAFFAVNGVEGPRGRDVVTHYSPAYDAGTEANDELCTHIPGPPTVCQGEGFNPARGVDNFVHSPRYSRHRESERGAVRLAQSGGAHHDSTRRIDTGIRVSQPISASRLVLGAGGRQRTHYSVARRGTRQAV